jgi:L,D-peptidoglycan transpeptidase YkuD (ErfK/YbiS/YcfS/YnhG family)
LIPFAKGIVIGREDSQLMPQTSLKTLRVRAGSTSRTRGLLAAGSQTWPVALGGGGILADKREGDGATPRGRFRLVRLWWNPERGLRPATRLPVRRIAADDAWCEDPADRRYNRPIKMATNGAGDRLRRADHLYDLIIEIDHNTRPRIARRGSAVFIHLARPGLAPTAGCVTMPKARLRQLLGRVGAHTRIIIG